ncbi:MAG: hypothetical protein KAT77_06205 [Nanoarchaeota archaeon]|nr:hypothetical protein [Nanoarchaeota archaeon]
MKETLGIEFICTGNGGRSPMAHTIGVDHVQEQGLGKRVQIYSSGTGAEATEKDLFSFPTNFLLAPIETALQNGVYQGKAVQIAQEVLADQKATTQAIESGDMNMMGKVKYCIQYLSADEVAKRNVALLEIGLVPVGHFHQQTTVREGVDLILPMKQSNADQVKEIYGGSGRSPIVVPICEYVGLEGAISDPFGGPMEIWRETRDKIAEVVVKSIDKAVGEYR